MAGVTETPDGIVRWVFGIVDGIAWSDVWRPVYNPEPMDTYAYRPLAVVLIKLGLLFTRDPMALAAVHALAIPAFGLAALGFLRRAGFSDSLAGLAASTAMAMPSLLFSGWIPVEFDLVGAAFVLAALSALHDLRLTPSRRARLRFVAFSALAILTKETSALGLFAFTVADAWPRRRELHAWRVPAAILLGIFVATLPLHFTRGGSVSAFSAFGEGFHPIRIPAMVLHVGAQLLYVVGPAGVLLLWADRLAGRRWLPVALWTATALLFFAPIVRHYSHFEAVVFSSPTWTIGLVALLWAALVANVRRDAPGLQGTGHRAALLMLIGFAAAPIVLRFARADVSARILAPAIPLLHALVWRAASAQRSGRLLAAVFGAFVVSAAVNAALSTRTRLAVEGEARTALAKDVRMPCPALIATNAVQWTTVEDLVAEGANLGACAWFQTTSSQPETGMTLAEFTARGGVSVDRGQDAYLVISTARSRMDEATNRILAGDFTWTSELLPESDDDLFAAYQRMVFEIETDLETLFRTAGARVCGLRSPYVALPLWWNELPARLLLGVPLVERFDWVASVYRIRATEPGFVPSGGRGRRDHAGDARR